MAEGVVYDADEDRFGGITITNISSGKSVYLQGDDASAFLVEWDTVVRIWTDETESDRRADYSGIDTYAAHFDLIADVYSEVME